MTIKSRRNKAKDPLQTVRQRAELLDLIPHLLFTAQETGAVDYFNSAWFAYSGLSLPASLDWGWLKALHSLDEERIATLWKLSIATGHALQSELRLKNRSGKYQWFLLQVNPILPQSGQATTWVGTFTEIEGQKKVIERLHNTQQILNDFLDHNPMLAFIKDHEGRYVYISKSFLEFFQVKKASVIDKTDFEWLPAELAKQFTENDDLVRTSGKPIELIETVSGDQGIVRSLVKKFPLTSPSGELYVCGIAVDIEERLRAEEQKEEMRASLKQLAGELAQARDQALEASNLKSAFLANISHELRTPLSGVMGMIELLLDTKLTKEQKILAETVQRSSQSLLSVVKDILDISKIEAGKLVLESVPFNLHVLVEDSALLMTQSAISKNLSLNIHLDERLPKFVQGDPERVRQMLIKLIHNGIKFTEQGEITIGSYFMGDDDDTVTVRFAVSDTGIGIASKEQRFLFESFTQVDGSTTRKYGGTGLGLSICKQLAEMMGGQIGVDSALGAGSLFWFTVPFRKAKNQMQLGGTESKNLYSPGRLAGKSALIVEDNPVLRLLTVRQLNNLGLETQEVSNGRDAVEAAKGFVFDVILMDCQLPELDGYDATREIRKLEALGSIHTPIIALTAGAMAGDQEKCFAAGMDDYLVKPVSIQQLCEKITDWVSPKRV